MSPPQHINEEEKSSPVKENKVDPSFRTIGKNAICFIIWKIEENQLEAQPKTHYGDFLEHNAYIIYAASPKDIHVHQDTITRECKNGATLRRFIHLWFGKEAGDAVRSCVMEKILELDTYFDHEAAIYREVQEHESARFYSYFKKGITINLNKSFVCTKGRLYQLSGHKYMRCKEMVSVGWEHFVSDCVMVLQTKCCLFVWIGRSTTACERRSAIDIAQSLQPNSDNIIIVDDGYEQCMPDTQKSLWNFYLPFSLRMVQTYLQESEKHEINKFKVYKSNFNSGRMHLDQQDVMFPTKKYLTDNTTSYLIDAYGQCIWIWIGSQATYQHRCSAIATGKAFLRKKKYQTFTNIIRISEGSEPTEFNRLFFDDHNSLSDCTTDRNKAPPLIFGNFDSMTLCQRPKLASCTQLLDDGSGERCVFCITSEQIVEMEASTDGIFINKYCYVVQYTVAALVGNAYDQRNIGIDHVVYQWIGCGAKDDIIAKCNSFAQSFKNATHKVMFVQIEEFEETSHFLQIFGGKLIVLINERDYFFNNNKYTDEQNLVRTQDEALILKVYGDASYNGKAIEVDTLPSLNTKDCYIVKGPNVWIWCGYSSTGDTREIAKNIASLLGEFTLVREGKEPNELKQLLPTNLSSISTSASTTSSSSSSSPTPSTNSNHVLGNKINYFKTTAETQLFHIYIKYGKFHYQEIVSFSQQDLLPECIYILDAGFIYFVWLGEHVNAHGKENYLKIAQLYRQYMHRPSRAIAVVYQNSEPNVFRGFFDSWNHDLWQSYVSYQQMRQVVNLHHVNDAEQSGSDAENLMLSTALLNERKEFDQYSKYPLALLQQDMDSLPSEVDPIKREVHLTHDDFLSLFKMTFWEFDELPSWRKLELKKRNRLF